MSEMTKDETLDPIPDNVLDAIHLREICDRLKTVLESPTASCRSFVGMLIPCQPNRVCPP
jgi:hypothetical protein